MLLTLATLVSCTPWTASRVPAFTWLLDSYAKLFTSSTKLCHISPKDAFQLKPTKLSFIFYKFALSFVIYMISKGINFGGELVRISWWAGKDQKYIRGNRHNLYACWIVWLRLKQCFHSNGFLELLYSVLDLKSYCGTTQMYLGYMQKSGFMWIGT